MATQLLLNEIGHLLFYIAFGLLVYLFDREKYSFRNLCIGTFSAFFIDVDHLYDYFLRTGINSNIRAFLTGDYVVDPYDLVLPFHGWEFAAILLIIWFRFVKDKKKYAWLLFIIIGYFAHLTFDVLSNGMHWTYYLFTYRVLIA